MSMPGFNAEVSLYTRSIYIGIENAQMVKANVKGIISARILSCDDGCLSDCMNGCPEPGDVPSNKWRQVFLRCAARCSKECCKP